MALCGLYVEEDTLVCEVEYLVGLDGWHMARGDDHISRFWHGLVGARRT